MVKEKSRKPKKEITLPHLELMAVTIAVRAANFITKDLMIPSLKRTFWTGSTCVLYWLRIDAKVATSTARITRCGNTNF